MTRRSGSGARGGAGLSVGGRGLRLGVGPSGLFVSLPIPGTPARYYFFSGADERPDTSAPGTPLVDPLDAIARARKLLEPPYPSFAQAHELLASVFDLSGLRVEKAEGCAGYAYSCSFLLISLLLPPLLLISVAWLFFGQIGRNEVDARNREALRVHIDALDAELHRVLDEDLELACLVDELVRSGGAAALPHAPADGLALGEPALLDVPVERVVSDGSQLLRVERGRLVLTGRGLQFAGESSSCFTPATDILSVAVEGVALLIVHRRQTDVLRYYAPGHALTVETVCLAIASPG